ncbi:Ribonuclease 3 [Stylophora pistillata]|uniref:Ribonuclease 3 n=1 Tax=Stylophora pistillata TaxID=50429 RepID=A0A2B4S762_STYPI|nr:Ribonuclease 3 [Stylophora pistillata]
MWRPPFPSLPGAQTFASAPSVNQRHTPPRFQTHLRQPAIAQSTVTNPEAVAPIQHWGSPPRLHGPLHPSMAGPNPPRSMLSTAPAPMISARGMTSPQHQSRKPMTAPSPVLVPSPVRQSSPFTIPPWQVRNPQQSGFNLNQSSSVMVSTPPSINRITPSTQQVFVSSPKVPPGGAPSLGQHPPVTFAFTPARIPPSPVQGLPQSSTSPSFTKVVGPINEPLTSSSVPSPKGVQAPQSSPFNNPLWQVKHPQPTLRSPGLTLYPRTQTSSVSSVPIGMPPVPRGMPPVPRGMSAVPRGMSAVPRGMSAVPRGMSAVPRGMSPVPRGVPFPVGVLHQRPQSLSLNSSAGQTRNPQPDPSFNLRHSFAAGFNRHLLEPQWRTAVPNIQHPSHGENLGPFDLQRENVYSKNKTQSPEMKQFISGKSRNSDSSLNGRPLYRRTGSHREGHRGREPGKRRSYVPGAGGRASPRVDRCYSPPPPDIERVITYLASDDLYIKKQNSEGGISIVQGTEKLSELQNKFQKEIVNMTAVIAEDDEESVDSGQSNPTETDVGDVELPMDSEADDGPESWIREGTSVSNLTEFLSDEESNIDEDDSEIGSKRLSSSSSESDDSDDNEDDEESGSSDHDKNLHEQVHKGSVVEETRKRKMQDPLRLHPELWFNEKGETNDGAVCRCSLSDKQHGIRHGIYPGESVIPACDPLTNNADKLHHYWVTVTPHSNFMTENPTIIQFDGKDYTFEGFSMFSHQPLKDIPSFSVIRFNIEYTLHFISQPVSENFCVRDLDLFTEFFFYKVLELADWDLNGNVQDSCQRFHFMPRFVHRSSNVSNSAANHELLSMSHVLSHILDSAEPLVKPGDFTLNADKLGEYSKSCVNSLVMNPNKKPVAIRVDDLQFHTDEKQLSNGKKYPYIVHHGIRPVQMSFAGDPKAVPSRKNQDKLVKLKIELENMRVKSAMRRDVLVEVSSKGMIKTGLKSDVCQHALLLPVFVHHVRYHMCLKTLDERMGYVFKDRSLLQLALTHPSYHLNFGMNPDHARNSLSNCGVKQPRYGDRKIRHLHTRKKGITQLIRVMSNLGKMEEHQSMIRHNERLEFLGDAVLELISSVHLYFMLPSKTEGGLAMYRSALVQNKHLAQLAKKLGLSDYMQYSHGPDLCVEDDLNHAMANCFEALLGAMYLESGLTSATILFTNVAFEEQELRDVWTNLPKHPLQAQQPDGDRHLIASSPILQKLEEFEKASGIEFTHIRLLARAFTHPQVGFNNLTLGSNQRMEFLGDSVLQFVVSVYLFKHFPEHHEGHLTLLRSSLVNHRIQATIARELGLDKLINFGNQGMNSYREKLLADILEAFVAALYVDKGLRYVETFCHVCLFPRLEEFIINQDWMDAKSQLQQCCLTSREQGKIPDLPQYKVLQNRGPAHHKRYTVAVYYKGRRMGSGEGKSIQQAEMAAAKDALASHYFPELARQKRLLDLKHQGRRRNYWNKVPRKESEEKRDREEDVEVLPRWEEKETFEEDDNTDVTQEECQPQEQ